MTTKPLSLDYQSPQIAPVSNVRRKACRYAAGSGAGCILLGTCIGLATCYAAGVIPPFAPPVAIIKVGVFVLYALAYPVCGTLNLVASIKFRRPNSAWERVFIINSFCHVGLILLIVLPLLTTTTYMGTRGDFNALVVRSCAFVNLIFVLSHVDSIQQLRHARRIRQ